MTERDAFRELVGAGLSEAEAARVLSLVADRLKGGIDPELPLSVSEMEAMATITDGDVAAARADWYAIAPAAFKRLLDAKEL